MLQLTARLRERGAEIVVVSCNPEILRLATRTLVLPTDIAERISPLVYISQKRGDTTPTDHVG
jgi:anti-anti-sigma regulatory factor